MTSVAEGAGRLVALAKLFFARHRTDILKFYDQRKETEEIQAR